MLSRIVVGASVLAAGIIFWLDHLDKIRARDYFVWWPVILLAFAVTHAIRRHWTAAIIFLILGIVFMPSLPFLPHLRLSQVFALTPLLISAAGVTLIMQVLRPAATG